MLAVIKSIERQIYRIFPLWLHVSQFPRRDLSTKKTKPRIEKLTRKPPSHVRLLIYWTSGLLRRTGTSHWNDVALHPGWVLSYLLLILRKLCFIVICSRVLLFLRSWALGKIGIYDLGVYFNSSQVESNYFQWRSILPVIIISPYSPNLVLKLVGRVV